MFVSGNLRSVEVQFIYIPGNISAFYSLHEKFPLEKFWNKLLLKWSLALTYKKLQYLKCKSLNYKRLECSGWGKRSGLCIRIINLHKHTLQILACFPEGYICMLILPHFFAGTKHTFVKILRYVTHFMLLEKNLVHIDERENEYKWCNL